MPRRRIIRGDRVATFYDNDVTCFVARGTGKSPLLAAAVGYPAT
jgi:hypothetical protein